MGQVGRIGTDWDGFVRRLGRTGTGFTDDGTNWDGFFGRLGRVGRNGTDLSDDWDEFSDSLDRSGRKATNLSDGWDKVDEIRQVQASSSDGLNGLDEIGRFRWNRASWYKSFRRPGRAWTGSGGFRRTRTDSDEFIRRLGTGQDGLGRTGTSFPDDWDGLGRVGTSFFGRLGRTGTSLNGSGRVFQTDGTGWDKQDGFIRRVGRISTCRTILSDDRDEPDGQDGLGRNFQTIGTDQDGFFRWLGRSKTGVADDWDGLGRTGTSF
ncbi:hypothetical protein FA10DRAFT_190034 [Acaromyces ingoldii]|uniref:Uncharacterized protein n=1 Tax=Acaromyces ingoldii TaxID=215250 RepID=A0A316YAU1_9BASI|nr:hypothetical protein FA10DRAFT_190034 [Acaromyces ingoldii]PWN86930.1 hypothetical protein FA10DRAFT_190034 [Acaromyces ingoldii]